MTSSSPQLGLNLTPADDNRKTFKSWRTELSGDSNDSNMMIIDREVGNLKQWRQTNIIFSATQPADQSAGDIWNEILP